MDRVGRGGEMGKGSRSGCKSASHQLFKDKAKNRVDDLQGMFTDLQFARKESRTGDVAVLEEQVHQMLREWKAELSEASPASSLHGVSHASLNLSSDLQRFLQLCEEEDDATSKLAELPPVNPKLEPDVAQSNVHSHQGGPTTVYHEGYYASTLPVPMSEFHGIDRCNHDPMGLSSTIKGVLEGADQLDYQHFNIHQNASHSNQQFSIHQDSSHGNQHFNIHQVVSCNNQQFNLHQDVSNNTQQFNIHGDASHSMFPHFDAGLQHGDGLAPNIADLLPTICPPASAFLRPKCALWDCPRPAKVTDCFDDYCSSVHAVLAWNEGPPGMSPVLRPGGIDLKDGPLFAALTAKIQGKNVGIPECEGAATAKSPWNAPELFDLSVLEGESMREWLFFDKPRRAFESGNRKQRSLPDYSGRGWHESRKQMMKDYGGLKRSYYMDPQPLNNFEWHLYEYEINNCDVCALYRLELKFVDAKKSGKGKISGVSLADLQQKMGKLNSDSPVDNKRSVKGRGKVNPKDAATSIAPNNNYLTDNVANASSVSDQSPSGNENLVYGPNLPYGYTIDTLNRYYGT